MFNTDDESEIKNTTNKGERKVHKNKKYMNIFNAYIKIKTTTFSIFICLNHHHHS